jgi:hypothetical protein
MQGSIDPTILKVLVILAIVVLSLIAVYFFFLLCLCIPWVQRQSLYAHNIHTAWWHNLNDPEEFGFASKEAFVKLEYYIFEANFKRILTQLSFCRKPSHAVQS